MVRYTIDSGQLWIRMAVKTPTMAEIVMASTDCRAASLKSTGKRDPVGIAAVMDPWGIEPGIRAGDGIAAIITRELAASLDLDVEPGDAGIERINSELELVVEEGESPWYIVFSSAGELNVDQTDLADKVHTVHELFPTLRVIELTLPTDRYETDVVARIKRIIEERK